MSVIAKWFHWLLMERCPCCGKRTLALIDAYHVASPKFDGKRAIDDHTHYECHQCGVKLP